jgi:hypothetical protein
MGALAPAILKNRRLAPSIFGHFSTVGKKLQMLNKIVLTLNTHNMKILNTPLSSHGGLLRADQNREKKGCQMGWIGCATSQVSQ